MLWSGQTRTVQRTRAACAEDRPDVTWTAGTVCLRDRALFADPGATACRTFLQRIFQVEEVRTVEIDRFRTTARIGYDSGAVAIDEILDRLATALRGGQDVTGRAVSIALPPADGRWTTIRVSRNGARLTTWEIVHDKPGRVRFRNELLRTEDEFATRVVRELSAVHGVETCHARRLTASLLVRFDPTLIDTHQLVRILDRLVQGSAQTLSHPEDPSPVPFTLANTSVGLAALGELALPALLPASALLLVGSNLTTFRAAWDEVRRRQIGLPVLSTTIIVVTLSSGQFLAAALMAWMIKFWHGRHRERLLATRRQLLPGIAQHRRFARLAGPDTAEVLLEELKPGDLIRVSAGDVIPADGRVSRGFALVDEGLLGNRSGLSLKRPGAAAFAGTRVHEGEFQLEVERVGTSTRASAFASTLGRTATPARSPSAVTAHGEAFAKRTVLPTVATAGLGLLVGDLTTAAAVLRPDYATGPGLGVALELLHDTAECARTGVMVRDPSALRRLAEADVFLFDDCPALAQAPLEVKAVLADEPMNALAALQYAATALRHIADERADALKAACSARGLALLDIKPAYHDHAFLLKHEGRWVTVADFGGNPEAAPSLMVRIAGMAVGQIDFRHAQKPLAAEALGELHGDDRLAIGLLSSRPALQAETLATVLGFQHVRAGLSSEAKTDLLRSFRARGLKVAYIGDCRSEAAAAREAHVSLSLAGEVTSESDPASIVFVGGGVRRLAWLREFARSHVSRVRTVHGSTLIPNLVCVAGAFLFGFTSMSTVVITNLGTWGVYTRLSHRVRQRSARNASPRRREVHVVGSHRSSPPCHEGNTSCELHPTVSAFGPFARD